VFRHTGAGNTTTYTFDTSVDLSTYPLMFVEFEPGARIARTTGDEAFTVYSAGNIIAARGQQITAVDMIELSKGGEVYAEWWGGRADSGTTDNTNPIQYALNTIGGKGRVQLFGGQYNFATTIEIPEYTTLAGLGRKATSLYYSGSSTAIRHEGYASAATRYGHVLKDFILYGTASATNGVYFIGCVNFVIDIGIEDFSSTSPAAAGIVLNTYDSAEACIHGVINDPIIDSCYHGIRFLKDAADPGTDGCNHITVQNGRITNYTGVGINIDAGENNTLLCTDCSTTVDGATVGIRVNDDVNCLIGVRTDNSASTKTGSIGISITASATGTMIFNRTGNGPETMLQDLGTSTVSFRGGDSGPPERKFRMGRLKIQDGSTASTVKCTVESDYLAQAISEEDNLGKSGSTTSFTLDANGYDLRIKSTALDASALGCMATVCYNASTTATVVRATAASGALAFLFTNASTGAAVDLTSLVDTGDVWIDFMYADDARL
jgi:hypothetical protein